MKKTRGGRRWRWSAGRSGGAHEDGDWRRVLRICSALVFSGLFLQLHLQSRFLSQVCSGSRAQHILDPELDGLEEVPGVEGPDMSWVAPFLYILRVLGGPESSSGGLTLSEKVKEQTLLWRPPPRCQPECSGRPDGSPSVLSVTPDHVMSSQYIPAPGVLAFGGWRVHPCWRPWSPVLSLEAPITAPSLPVRPALATGSGGQCLAGSPPGGPLALPAPRLPPWRAHSLRPARLASSGLARALGSPGAVLSAMPDPAAERLGHTVSPSPLWALSAPASGPQCRVGPVHPRAGPLQPPCCDISPEPATRDHRSPQVTSCCTALALPFFPALRPSRLWRGPREALPELLLLPAP